MDGDKKEGNWAAKNISWEDRKVLFGGNEAPLGTILLFSSVDITVLVGRKHLGVRRKYRFYYRKVYFSVYICEILFVLFAGLSLIKEKVVSQK